jgi:hypothetical protein
MTFDPTNRSEPDHPEHQPQAAEKSCAPHADSTDSPQHNPMAAARPEAVAQPHVGAASRQPSSSAPGPQQRPQSAPYTQPPASGLQPQLPGRHPAAPPPWSGPPQPPDAYQQWPGQQPPGQPWAGQPQQSWASPAQPPNRAGLRGFISNFISNRPITAALSFLSTLIVAGLGIYLPYKLGPSQQVQSQQAVEQYQQEQDAKSPPVRVEDVTDPGTNPNVSTDAVIDDLDGRIIPYGATGEDPRQLLPSPVPLADVIHGNSGFVSGGRGHIGFTLTGLHRSTVRLADIQVVVVGRKPAPRGTLIFYPPQGNVPNLKLGFDLDSNDTSARTVGERATVTSEDYFKNNTVTLAQNESLGFNGIAVTGDCDCTFNLEAKFSDGSVLKIDDKGQPFRLAAYRADTARMYAPQYVLQGSVSQSVLTSCPSMNECAQIAYEERRPS